MPGWSEHTGTAVALPLSNVDTDQLIPARFMSVPRAEGYGEYLLHDLRRDGNGQLLPDFPLNRQANASILIAGRNFGSGSSREAAVYALVDAGFRAVLAPSFGDIFAGNAVNNGLLPARIGEADCQALLTQVGDRTTSATIDLNHGTVVVAGTCLSFALDDTWCTKLRNGWDDIDLTQKRATEIQKFRVQRHKTAPWAWPAVTT